MAAIHIFPIFLFKKKKKVQNLAMFNSVSEINMVVLAFPGGNNCFWNNWLLIQLVVV